MIIEWIDFPEDKRAQVEPYINRFACLIPKSLHRLTLIYTRDLAEGRIAEVVYSDEYQTAGMKIDMDWFREDYRNDRAVHILHEIIEIAVGSARKFCCRMFDTCVETGENGPRAKFIEAEMTRVWESTIQSLAYSLVEVLPE